MTLPFKRLRISVTLLFLLALYSQGTSEKVENQAFAPSNGLWEEEFLHNSYVPAVERNRTRSKASALPARVAGGAQEGWRFPFSKEQPLLIIDTNGLTALERLTISGDLLPVYQVSTDRFAVYTSWTPSIYDRFDNVFLSEGDTTTFSASMGSMPAFNSLTPQGSEVSQSRIHLYDEDHEYVRLSPAPNGERLHASWVLYPTSGYPPQSSTLTFSFNDYITTTNAEIGLELYSLTQWSGTNPDHHAEIEIDSYALPLIEWEGVRNFNDTAGVTLSGTGVPGTLSLTHAVSTNSTTVENAADSQMLNRFELRYEAYPRIDEYAVGELTIDPATSPQLATIGGFPVGTSSSDVLLLDVTDPANPLVLTNPVAFTDSSGTVAFEFEIPAGSTSFVIQRLADIPEPSAVAIAELPDPSVLTTNPLERLYIAPEEFHGALAPLISHRGTGTLIIDPQAAYDAYSFGRTSPQAIKMAIEQTLAGADTTVSLPSVLLIGYTSFDPKNSLGHYSGPQVPAWYEDATQTSIGALEMTVDYHYSTLTEGDDLPDVAVGRIPAKTAAELTQYIDRLLAYEAREADLSVASRPGVFIADNTAEFSADQSTWETLWSPTGHVSTLIDSDDNNTAPEKAAITDALSTGDGASLLLYNGHGNTNRWGTATLWNNNDVNNTDTQNRWPIVATFTCLNGYYAFPGAAPSFAQLWLFNTTDRGAVAMVAPSGVDIYSNQSEFTARFLESYRYAAGTIGQALTNAQRDFVTDFPTKESTRHEYLLFGDPETPLFLNREARVPAELWMIE